MKSTSLCVAVISVLSTIQAWALPHNNATIPAETTKNATLPIPEAAAVTAPYFVVYSDSYDGNTGPPAASALKVRFFRARFVAPQLKTQIGLQRLVNICTFHFTPSNRH